VAILDDGRSRPDITPIYGARHNLVTYLDRIDPLYEVTWRDGVNINWRTIHALQHGMGLNAHGQLVHTSAVIESPIDMPPGLTHAHASVQIMASLIQFYQLSTYQLATLLGTSANRIWRWLSALYAHGVIERAVPHWIGGGIASDRGSAGTGSLWRVAAHSERFEAWLDGLSDVEYLLLTGGVDVTRGTNSSRSATSLRHNFALAEIMVRALEIIPSVAGVWGESFTRADLLMDPTLKQDWGIRDNVADGAVVLRDGRIILLETSGAQKLDNKSNGPRLQAKAAAWATVAALSDLDISVVFVDIAQATSRRRFRHHVQQGVEAASANIANQSLLRRGQQSVFLADAHDWFPFALSIARGFQRLEAWSPVTERYHDLIPAETEVDLNSDPVINTVGSLHTPAWAFTPVRDLVTA